MSSWLDLDRSDDESLSSSDNERDDMGSLTDHMNNLSTNKDTLTPTMTSTNAPAPKKYTIKSKSKSMTLPTSFRPPATATATATATTHRPHHAHHASPHRRHHHHHRSPPHHGLPAATAHKKHKLNKLTADDMSNELKRTYSYPLPDTEPFCVWLGNLPAEAKPSDIVQYLEPLQIQPRDIRFGRIHKNKYTCAYVDFYNKGDMQNALQSIDCSAAPLFMGRQVEIDINEGIVVDREAAVTCTSSSSALNSPFRPQKNNSASKQDVRYTGGSPKGGKQKHSKQKGGKQKPNKGDDREAQMQMNGGSGAANDGMMANNSNNSGDYYTDKRIKHYQGNTFNDRRNQRRGGRGRGRGRNRDRSYFRGQYGHYRQKNGNKYLSHANSSPSFASFSASKLTPHTHSGSPTKPIKILQRPKQNKVAAVAQQTNMQSDANKSRFPTLEEDHKQSAKPKGGKEASAVTATVQDYNVSSNHGDNNAYFNSNYYGGKSNKRHINNNTFNNNQANMNSNNNNNNMIGMNQSSQAASAYQSYKQKRHRNRDRAHSDRNDYYPSAYKGRDSYRDHGGRNHNDNNHYNSGYGGSSNKSYSKKRHSNYGY